MKETWDQRYSGEEYAYGTLPNVFFKEIIETLLPGKLLLPAEGEGRNAVFAATLGWDVTAVDFSEQARNKAMKLAAINKVNIDYLLGDLSTLDFKNELYDAAGLIYLHMPVEYRTRVHKNIMKSIRPGGFIILEAFNKKQIANDSGGPKSPELLYSVQELKNDFEGLEIIILEEMKIHLEQGAFHRGESEIIRLFGRKPLK